MTETARARLAPELAGRSLSQRDIVLVHDDAVLALEHLAGSGLRLEAWEGWVQLPTGGRAPSLAHPGSFALPLDVRGAADMALRGMARAQAVWDRAPEYPGGTLYFRLTFVPE